jgi:hypothetical protein
MGKSGNMRSMETRFGKKLEEFLICRLFEVIGKITERNVAIIRQCTSLRDLISVIRCLSDSRCPKKAITSTLTDEIGLTLW